MTGFLIETVIISLSGVMAPGALSAVTINHGMRNSRAGVSVAIGHGIVEVPLLILIYYGVGALMQISGFQVSIGILGGVLMAWMGMTIIRSSGTVLSQARRGESSVWAGVMLSAGNPYFLIWWATVGSSLVIRSVEYGLVGVLLFGICHWMCDLVWLWLLAFLAHRASASFGGAFVRITSLVSGSFLLIIGFRFLYQALSTMNSI
ncbi:MAG TPA: LysE family transporter [Anaerolineales bacterium]|nr:LysE family transporter [Anaerolineales bacterium]|tara:strand:+ start:868 stop:1482 length:615 start_codon:yes stop_codon:yes gene_type:complete